MFNLIVMITYTCNEVDFDGLSSKRQTLIMVDKLFIRFIYWSIFLMIQIVFQVRAPTLPDQIVCIVGSLPQLGSWDPEDALELQCKKGLWEGVVLQATLEDKFEFKIIKVNKADQIVWQQLPNNSNRKFKPRGHTLLHLEWGKAQGKITFINHNSYKPRGMPGVMICRGNTAAENKALKKQDFDPYRNTRGEQSDSQNDEEFELVKRKMSDEIGINSVDFQELFYTSSNVQIFGALLNKIKIYVVSKEIDPNVSLNNYIEKGLKQLPSNYLARWITAECLLERSMEGLSLNRKDSIYQVKAEQLSIESLYSRSSYFMFVELDTVLMLDTELCRVPSCLFLSAHEFEKVIERLTELSHIQLICFDDPAANKSFYEYLCKNSTEGVNEHNGSNISMSVIPSIEDIIKQLERLRFRESVIINTLGCVSEDEGLKILAQQNTVNIIDAGLINNYPSFAEAVISNLHNHSLLIVISSEDLSENVLSFSECKNVVLVYKNFERVILQGRDYHPLRKIQETFDLLRMKSKLYHEHYGGELFEKQSSIIYNFPANKQQLAIRVQNECKNVVKGYEFIKVTRKGTRVKVVWNLSLSVRMLRTLCEVKYINYGALGNFNIVVDSMSLKELKEDLRLLIQYKPKLFLSASETDVKYYSYGNNQPASCTIIPNETKE